MDMDAVHDFRMARMSTDFQELAGMAKRHCVDLPLSGRQDVTAAVAQATASCGSWVVWTWLLMQSHTLIHSQRRHHPLSRPSLHRHQTL